MLDPSFTLTLTAATHASDHATLLTILHTHASAVRPLTPHGPPAQHYHVIVDPADSVVGTLATLIKISTTLSPPLAHARRRGTPVVGSLHRREQPPLDLATATEQHLLVWLVPHPSQQG